MERAKYEYIIKDVIQPIIDITKNIDDYYLRELWFTILDATERSLSMLLFFKSPLPDDVNYDLELSHDDILYWFKRTSLCFISYIYHYYTPDQRVKMNNKGYLSLENNKCDGKIIDVYYKYFNERPDYQDVVKYSLGLNKDEMNGYSLKGDTETAMRLTAIDGITIGRELLHNIWHEDTEDKNIFDNSNMFGVNINNPITKKMATIGIRIWQAYQQIIQPFLQNNPIGKTPFKARIARIFR